jgi:galactokinase
MLGSHLSLKYNYEVSAEELDFLVEQAFKTEGIVAARMTGAGFGGCTINIVNEDHIDKFIGKMLSAYESRYNKELWIKEVLPVDGLTSGIYENIQ